MIYKCTFSNKCWKHLNAGDRAHFNLRSTLTSFNLRSPWWLEVTKEITWYNPLGGYRLCSNRLCKMRYCIGRKKATWCLFDSLIVFVLAFCCFFFFGLSSVYPIRQMTRGIWYMLAAHVIFKGTQACCFNSFGVSWKWTCTPFGYCCWCRRCFVFFSA